MQQLRSPSDTRADTKANTPATRSLLLPEKFRAALPLWLLALGIAGVIGALVAWNAPVASVLVAVGLVGSTTVALRAQLPRLALSFLGVCLLGYALLGKGFAYIGVPPLFVGEMVLGLCLLALLLRGQPGLLGRSPLLYLLLAYMAVGLVATVPFVQQYGIDAVRDAVLWGYGLFALCVAVLLVQYGWVLSAVRRYTRLIPLFLCVAPFLLLTGKLLSGSGPKLPGTEVALLDLKGGDVAVILAMIATFLLLGLHRLPELGAAGRALGEKREWLWWLLWIAAAAIPLFRVRAGILAVGAAILIVVVGRAASRWQKPLLTLLTTFAVLAVFNVQIQLGGRTTVSVESLLANVQSISSSTTGDESLDGSRRWRLLWWNDIVNYTVRGPYFWTGKGYGLNLADADGYQLGYASGEATLRSPHNVHLNILARSGLPGALAWAALQLTFAGMLILAYRRARARGQDLWARMNLWTLASWAAFVINASFDVYLEGPQGGIWFWSFFGFGMALLEVQRRGAATGQLGWLLPATRPADAQTRQTAGRAVR